MNQIDNRYRIAKELGRGGMGVVYLAHDEVIDRDVAIKLVSGSALNAKGKARLLREARLAGKLNHPNIVSIYDAGEADGSPYIVMEFVEGKPVYDDPPREMDEILELSVQLCEALAHAHEQGIVHRDLKPENLLLTDDGKLKLTDFGVATGVGSRISTDGAVVGTVYYLAPEILQGQEVDPRADLYSLGILLYEWCTGQLPFLADDPMAIITQHLFTPAVPPRAKAPHVPETIDQLILHLLNKDPADRPASAAEVIQILEAPAAREIVAQAAPRIPALDWIGRGRMTGREHELQLARSLWARVSGGQGRALLISGEAGIGKTRLLHELFALAEVTGATVLRGLNNAQVKQPFAAFKSILRSVLDRGADGFGSLPEQAISDLLVLVPEYQEDFGEVYVRASVETDYEQLQLFESAAMFFRSMSHRAPILLAIEDAQWADSGTLHLLQYLIQQAQDWPILFVLTYRDLDLPETLVLQEVILDLQRQQLATLMALKRLTSAETEAMLTTLLSGQLAPDLVDEIYAVTEGNPFFAEEICKGLVENQRLILEGDRLQSTGSAKLDIPPNVRVAIQGRIRAVPAETRRLLEAAAVRGREFEVDVVEDVERFESFELTEALQSAIRAQIIEEIPTDNGRRFRFTHTLIPAAMREDMTAKRQKTLHARMAPVLEAAKPEDFEALAHHYQSAGQPGKASHYHVLAGDRAYGHYACREAIRHFSEASVLQKRQNDNEAAARTLFQLGQAYSADFQFDQAQAAYQEAFELWDHVWKKAASRGRIEPEQTLRFAIDEPITIDPGEVDDDLSFFIVGQLFEGLVQVDVSSGIIPALASEWDISEDGKRYTFRLRDDWQWTDGRPITAADFEYAWKRNLSLGPDSPALMLLGAVENAREFAEGRADEDQVGARAIDSRTLEVRLSSPASYFLQVLASPATYPLPKWAIDRNEEAWTSAATLVSNGPYRLQEWDPGKMIRMNFNPGYRGLFPGNVGRIEAPVIGQYDPVIQAYDKGALDGISLVNAEPSTIARLKTAYRKEFRFVPALSTLYLGFRADISPFNDGQIRKAFAHAIDRTALLIETGSVHYLPALGGFLPPGMPGYSPRLSLGYDPGEARRLIAESVSWPAEPPRPIELLYTGDPRGNPIASYLKQEWQSVLGIEVTICGLPWNEFIDRVDHDPPHITIMGWQAENHDPDYMLRVPFHSRDGQNRIRWHNPEYDSLTEEAAKISDRNRRIELYQAADRILVAEEAAVMPLGYAQGRQLVKPHVKLPRSPPAFTWLKNATVRMNGD